MKDFEEFWPHYVDAHAHPKNRRLHFSGMAVIHVILFYVFITGHLLVLWLVPVFGLAFIWARHSYIKENLPIVLKYPLWSALAELRMFYSFIFKKM